MISFGSCILELLPLLLALLLALLLTLLLVERVAQEATAVATVVVLLPVLLFVQPSAAMLAYTRTRVRAYVTNPIMQPPLLRACHLRQQPTRHQPM
jgi:hypothetical protein